MQAALLPNTPDTPAVQAPAPEPDQPARFAVMGLLRQAARTYACTGGAVVLEVLVRQHLQMHPDARDVLVRYRYPDQGCPNTTALVASNKAARMPAGAEVVCSGSALYPGHYHGAPVTVLDDVRGIELVAELLPGHQP